jgi:signal transduction histidine kinase
MKLLSFIPILYLSTCPAIAQHSHLDSLKEQVSHAVSKDTSRALALATLADYYGFLQFDSCLFYAHQALDLSEKLNYSYGRYYSNVAIFHGLNSQGNYASALQAAIKIRHIADQMKEDKLPWQVPASHYFMGLVHKEMSNYAEAKTEFLTSIALQKAADDPIENIFASFAQMGILYLILNRRDSALIYARKGYDFGLKAGRFNEYYPVAIGALGNVYADMGNFKEAEKYFKQALDESKIYGNTYFLARNYNNLASIYAKQKLNDSCIRYANLSLSLCAEHRYGDFAYDISKILVTVYDSAHKPDSTLKYMRIMIAAKDTVFSQTKGQQFQQYAFNEIQRLQKINIDRERFQSRVKIYLLLGGVTALLIVGFLLYRNNAQKQRAKAVIEKAYSELKATQAQLIQSEKMASLGELTAGIAHEIQNPLNFVNNFSEVNNELIDELEGERSKVKGERNEKVEDEILNDIKQNLEKISHHGKRADAIVKGMLQHTRISSGQKEATDINALADEFLRLAYHGFRAKDKSFNAITKTEFDNTIGKINVMPQEIGRVILNLINNAFYAVDEKKKTASDGYEPTVIVSTRKEKDKIEVKVKDNGNGIPQKVLEKIFQPFFTTKPAGQGTGLGLSLAYDIVKAHGGEIKVDTKEKDGSEFILLLPIYL